MPTRAIVLACALALLTVFPGAASAQLLAQAPTIPQDSPGLGDAPPPAPDGGGSDDGSDAPGDDSGSPDGATGEPDSANEPESDGADDGASDRELPNTGSDPRLLLLAGMSLMLVGAGLRLRTADADLY